MDEPAVVAAWAGVAVALLGVVVAGIATWGAARSARAAERQVQLQQEVNDAAAQPYVWVSIARGDHFVLSVGNSGATMAHSVVITPDRAEALGGDNWIGYNPLSAMMQAWSSGKLALAPGQRLSWMLGTRTTDLEEDSVVTFAVDVVADSGPLPRREIPLDFLAVVEADPDPTLWRNPDNA